MTAAAPTATVSGGVLRVELPGTPLDAALAGALLDLLPAPDDLEAPPVLLLTGRPGTELAGLGEPGDGPLPPGLADGHPGGTVAACVARLGEWTGVSVLALSGDARGCGAELALACDLRIAWSRVRLQLPHVGHGVVPGCGATQRLPRLVGPGLAARLLLLGDEIDGEAMVAAGLASACVPGAEEAVELAEATARRLAAQAPAALRACKEAMTSGMDLTLRDGLRLEADLAVLLQTTEDRGEGIRAFLERRTPRFTGR